MTLKEFFDIYDPELYNNYWFQGINFDYDGTICLLDTWDEEEQTAEFRIKNNQQGQTQYRNFGDVESLEIINPRQVIIEIYGI